MHVGQGKYTTERKGLGQVLNAEFDKYKLNRCTLEWPEIKVCTLHLQVGIFSTVCPVLTGAGLWHRPKSELGLTEQGWQPKRFPTSASLTDVGIPLLLGVELRNTRQLAALRFISENEAAILVCWLSCRRLLGSSKFDDMKTEQQGMPLAEHKGRQEGA